jgi:hypothetical protein
MKSEINKQQQQTKVTFFREFIASFLFRSYCLFRNLFIFFIAQIHFLKSIPLLRDSILCRFDELIFL